MTMSVQRNVRIKRVGVLSVGLTLGGIYGLLGLIAGLFITLISLFGTSVGSAIFGVFAIILLPILYGLAGFIGGLISALVYNLIASKTGGIEMDLD